jgi:hypothetical protein
MIGLPPGYQLQARFLAAAPASPNSFSRRLGRPAGGLCLSQWTKRDVLDESMYISCMKAQDDGYYKFEELAKANSAVPWIQDLIDNIGKHWTKGGIRDDHIMGYVLEDELDAFEDLVFYSKKPEFDLDKYQLYYNNNSSVFGINFHIEND